MGWELIPWPNEKKERWYEREREYRKEREKVSLERKLQREEEEEEEEEVVGISIIFLSFNLTRFSLELVSSNDPPLDVSEAYVVGCGMRVILGLTE